MGNNENNEERYRNQNIDCAALLLGEAIGDHKGWGAQKVEKLSYSKKKKKERETFMLLSRYYLAVLNIPWLPTVKNDKALKTLTKISKKSAVR